jgi:hypothetical protein
MAKAVTKCELCGRKFKNNQGLLKHLRSKEHQNDDFRSAYLKAGGSEARLNKKSKRSKPKAAAAPKKTKQPEKPKKRQEVPEVEIVRVRNVCFCAHCGERIAEFAAVKQS